MKIGNIGQVTFALGLAVFALLALRLFIIPNTTQVSVSGQLNYIDLGEVPVFAEIDDIATKKQTFFDYLRPVIEAQNQIIIHERQFLLAAIEQIDNGLGLSEPDNDRLKSILDKYQYDIKSFTRYTLMPLLKRIDIIPVEMVLVQAATESGWGSSRFAIDGFNFFGQWCFTDGCGLVPFSRGDGKNHEVAVFDSPKDSIIAYMINLNTHSAYKLFRSIRADLRAQKIRPTAERLVYGLINYSERRDQYIDELLEMLKHNKPYLQGNNANA
ncbi:glucosaminidase domain-containing protein [Shewanella livingstonensis]|uniref:Glucosaminidase n=1 Tax=Shewanella livingstonensis TaxID=150120 RepID=A0A3G8LUZ8_9GAMM|nr:glucosaminidase domain-containing protein [Shewanella livingstonensis]AZG73327.1 glucosaminidase [Shewanella livingstonensis]